MSVENPSQIQNEQRHRMVTVTGVGVPHPVMEDVQITFLHLSHLDDFYSGLGTSFLRKGSIPYGTTYQCDNGPR